jgi:hypothetical protein
LLNFANKEARLKPRSPKAPKCKGLSIEPLLKWTKSKRNSIQRSLFILLRAFMAQILNSFTSKSNPQKLPCIGTGVLLR